MSNLRRTKGAALRFPNLSRSFEPARRRIRFWGYDEAIEITFFLETSALQKLTEDMMVSETACLDAFDAARDRIQEAAAKVYGRDHAAGYTVCLGPADFHE